MWFNFFGVVMASLYHGSPPQRMYQSSFMREICDEYNVNAFGLRRQILRSRQSYNNWDLIKKFCRQELSHVDGLDELFKKYYDASILR